MKERTALTASAIACALACPRRYYYRQVLGLHVASPSDALRIGTAVHNALEARARGADFHGQYMAAVTGATLNEYMAARVFGIVAAYDETYGETNDALVERMDPEVEFACAIAGSRSFEMRGKLDGLAFLRDGRRVIVEHKTTSEDIAETSGYWQRLRINHQLLAYSAYVYGEIGRLPVCVYDVIRKPAVNPKANVADVDADGVPIVMNTNGERCIKRDGTPKRTADASKGEFVQSHMETADEFGDRVRTTMADDSARYFARREVTVTRDMIEEFEIERRCVCRLLLHFAAESRKAKLAEHGYPRACSPDNCRLCEYAGFCLERIHVDADSVPQGFVLGVNPELSTAHDAQSV